MTINEHSITFPSLSLIVNIKSFFLSVTILLNSVPRFIEATLKPKFPPRLLGSSRMFVRTCSTRYARRHRWNVLFLRSLASVFCMVWLANQGLGWVSVCNCFLCCFFNFVFSLLFFMMSCFVICLFIILHLVILIFTLWLYLHYYGFHFSLYCLCIYLPLIELTMPSLMIT